MRLTPWLLPFALSAALLTTTGYVFADSHESEGEQHEPLDDEALEEEYGIKAGSVKRDEDEGTSYGASSASTEDKDVELEPGKSEDRNPEAGTGGTGSPEDAIHSSEEENSEDDEEGTDDNE